MRKNISLEKEYKELKRKIKLYNEKCDFDMVDKAWEFAKLAHYGQIRASGSPYNVHSLKTAEKLAEWRLDTTSIVVGLLHDTVEKGGANRKDIQEMFGEDMESLVDGVTEISKIKLKGSDEELFVENLRKMFIAMAKDIRVVIVRLAERYHNMETLSFMSRGHQVRISKETAEVFAPLAERLGMGEVQGGLEDLAFPYLHPKEHRKVIEKSKKYFANNKSRIEKMKTNITRSLAKEKINAEIRSRAKHVYSLWRKLERPGIDWDFDKVHDIVALRVLVGKVEDCYSTLGLIHKLYKPVLELGIKDYIARPKPNGYRSIHTRVFGEKLHLTEIQIRTFDMHEQAEFGVAAHWAYTDVKKQAKVHADVLEKSGVTAKEDKLKWVKELAKWQKEIVDSEEFLKAVKLDALSERIYVFSPKGDVYDLPLHATPVDFAYTVHTGLGEYIQGAKVNGRLVALNSKLHSGDVVEIIKSKNIKKPSHGWIDFVVTTTAKRKIKTQLRLDN